MDPITRSRRAVLGLGAALAAGVLAACGRGDAPRPAPAPPTEPAPASPTRAAGPTATGVGGEIVAGPRTRRQVALTFHGSGDPALTTRALEVLRAGHAHVTVLAVGRWLEANPALAGPILEAGHEVGNHTYTHPALPDLGAAAVRREIEGCRDVLIAMAGTPGRWFRPSGTPHATPLIRRAAAAAGYPVCLSYDVDPLDYLDPGPALVRSRVAATVRPGSIVSLHLGHPGTVAALPGILADLHARGLAAVTVSTLVGPR
jgi:peptidoglycan/xylan/chitin deacetylase (PgdA/CDA1 family)